MGRLQAQSDAETSLTRAALTADAGLVRAMLDAITASSSPEPICLRDAALVATAYTTAGRRSELAALTVSDATADGPEYRLLIRRGKRDQLGTGRTARVINSRSIPAADHLCRWITHHPLARAMGSQSLSGSLSGSWKFRQAVHNVHRLNAHGHDPLDEVNDVSRVSVFHSPVVRVVGNSSVFVCGDDVSLP